MQSFAVLLLILVLSGFAHTQTISGSVSDLNGAAIDNAEVRLYEGQRVQARTTTDSEGRFSLNGTGVIDSRLQVTAPGFVTFSVTINEATESPLKIILRPASLTENVTVSITRTETRLSETPASVVVLTREGLESTAALTIDDSLRQIAGFTLFRRSSSRTTNPTAQGANLRGISGSGASRAAVLFDGLSLNDAFGGWTYWSRVPLVAVERAEVLRGGASSLYGSGGLSGAVNIQPVEVEEDGSVLNFRASAGTQDTYDSSLHTALSRSGWAFDLAAETFQTGGYIPVAVDQRGLADTPANSRHRNGLFSIERSLGRRSNNLPVHAGKSDVEGRIFVRGNLFDERRDNGTSLTYNRTYFRQAAGGADLFNGGLGELRFRTFIESQVYDQTFSAVSADRNTETLSRLQRVPSQAMGVNLFWTKPISSHVLAASFEMREVRGFSDEVGYFSGRPTSVSGSGGTERTIALSVQDNWSVTEKLNLSFGVRADNWRNFDAHSTARTLATNLVTVAAFPDRSETAVSPRLAAIYQAARSAAVYGSYTRSFRAPTLNELYRGFRVGSIVTQPNENLRAEYADTLEAGVSFAAFSRRLSIRSNAFVTWVSDPIVSVTLSATPALITRQRQNVGQTRTRGIEVDAEYAPRSDLRLSASYLFADSRVTDFPAGPELVGRSLPQVPGQQLTLQLNYRPLSKLSFAIRARASDGQWEDDLNTLRLRPYFTMDASAGYRVNDGIEFFTAAENIFNSRYDIGLTPVRTVAAPALIRIGLRLSFGGR